MAQSISPPVGSRQSTLLQNPGPDRKGFITCYMDVANSKTSVLGWTFGNSLAQISEHSAPLLHVPSALAAEALAMRAAILQATTLSFNRVIFNSDSQLLIRSINQGSSISAIHGILSNISMCAARFISIQFIFIPGGVNVRADSLTNHVLTNVIGQS